MIRNFTPHPVNIIDGKIFESVGTIRLAVKAVEMPEIDGIKTIKTSFGKPVGLPDQVAGTFLIVSQLVKSACPDRSDLLVPAEVVRDKEGKIIGCKALGR